MDSAIVVRILRFPSVAHHALGLVLARLFAMNIIASLFLGPVFGRAFSFNSWSFSVPLGPSLVALFRFVQWPLMLNRQLYDVAVIAFSVNLCGTPAAISQVMPAGVTILSLRYEPISVYKQDDSSLFFFGIGDDLLAIQVEFILLAVGITALWTINSSFFLSFRFMEYPPYANFCETASTGFVLKRR